jgi:excinuclease UvrABC ATPase subunit
MTVITGVSGSGKSTLAFDVIFGEGQRRYLESLNAYARQFVQPASRPDVAVLDVRLPDGSGVEVLGPANLKSKVKAELELKVAALMVSVSAALSLVSK